MERIMPPDIWDARTERFVHPTGHPRKPARIVEPATVAEAPSDSRVADPVPFIGADPSSWVRDFATVGVFTNTTGRPIREGEAVFVQQYQCGPPPETEPTPYPGWRKTMDAIEREVQADEVRRLEKRWQR